MKKIVHFLIIIPVCVFGQTTSQNYLKTLTYKSQSSSSDPTKADASVVYYDGLGRPIQQIANKQSGTGKDIITHIEYDGFGRQSKQYLPYATTTDNMTFNASAQANTVAFYNTSAFQNTANPYSESFFEASPLNRVMKQSAPGTPWLGNVGNDNDHTKKYAYLFNTNEDAVKKLTATLGQIANGVYPTTLLNNGTYAAGNLYKTIIQDENKASAIHIGNSINSKLNTTEEFKNQDGQIVLKRNFVHRIGSSGNVIPVDTYYVYDQFGNLTYVIPPLASGVTITLTVLDKLCYQYKYDYRNRLVEKKLPGKSWQYIVYDGQDRVVANGPAINPWGGNDTNTGWMITKYDAFGRVAYTGWYNQSDFGSTTRNSFQANMFSTVTKTTSPTSIDNINVYYTNSFPTNMKVLTINYYDNYIFAGAPTSTIQTTPILLQPTLTNVKGLPTGNWVRALTSATATAGETSYTIYDRKSRPIRVRTTNYLGGYTEIDSEFDFDGTLLKTVTRHRRQISTNYPEIETTEIFTYTEQDRLLSRTHKIGNLNVELMQYNTYNAIGQLTRKKVGNTSSAALQDVDYRYNIRGWLTDINDINNLGNISGIRQDLFAFKINYTDEVVNTASGSVRLFNGNIAETTWRTASDDIQRRYQYRYDKLNRLLYAHYQIPQSSVPDRFSYNETLNYDINGNITYLARNGGDDNLVGGITIDELNYTYDGNQLMSVVDYENNPAGFNDGNTTGDDYAYDTFGNMITDKNKGIGMTSGSLIEYNHLNLPVIITINNGTNIGTISYLYSAAGVKLKKTVTPNAGTPIVTDYLGGYQYKDNILDFFPTIEGYVKHTRINNTSHYNYVFQYKDHLGNNRISYTVDEGQIKILEEDHYYAFGLKHEGYSANQQIIAGGGRQSFPYVAPVMNPGDVTYKYMYNGKELQDELGLNNYDFGARNYDPAIGRWMNIDPLAEMGRKWTPYNFCANNPIYYTDPDGMWITIYNAGTPYRYINGKVYGQNEETNEWDIDVTDKIESDSFAGKIIVALDKINSKDFGKKILDIFNSNDIDLFVKKDDINRGGGKTVLINPDIKPKLQTLDGIKETDVFIVLVHEIGHVLGSYFLDRGISKSIWITPGTKERVVKEEVWTVTLENFVRQEHNIPLRSHYLNRPELNSNISEKDFNKTQIIKYEVNGSPVDRLTEKARAMFIEMKAPELLKKINGEK